MHVIGAGVGRGLAVQRGCGGRRELLAMRLHALHDGAPLRLLADLGDEVDAQRFVGAEDA